MGRSPEQMRRSPEQVRRAIEQENRGADPMDYAQRPPFELGSLRLPPSMPPNDQLPARAHWRTAHEDEADIDFARFGQRPLPELRTGRRALTLLGQVTFGLMIVAGCG